MDLASETGKFGLDDVSLTDPFLSGSDKAILRNPKHPFNVQLNSQLRKASDLKKKSTGCSLPPPVIPRSTTIPLQRVFRQSPQASGNEGASVLGTVCHGPAILPGVIDSKTGRSIIEGKTVTGFTIEGELIFRILDKLRADNVLPVVEAVTKVGAFYSSPMGAFDDYSVTSGRVVTGTNPAVREGAERAVKVFASLQ